MSGVHVEVNLDMLRSLGEQVRVMRRDLFTLEGAGGVHAVTTLGSADIERALHEFDAAWQVGHTKISDRVDALSALLDAAVVTYTAAETSLMRAVDPVTSSAPGTSASSDD